MRIPALCLSLLSALRLSAAGPDLLSIQPPIISSTNGSLHADLVVKAVDRMINGLHVVNMKSYNGTFPGPSFHVKAGDTMFIRYINRLDENPMIPGMTSHDMSGMPVGPHGFNTINFHTHGLNVSPEGFADNVLLDIEPGHWVPYEIPIATNHPSGFFWYHPHKHGAVNNHLASGLVGNLMISGSGGDLDEISQIKAARKVELIVNQLQLVAETNSPGTFFVPEFPLDGLFAPLSPSLHNVYTLNGYPILDAERTTNRFLELPEIRIRPGEVQRWQFLHAGLDRFLWLTISNDAGGALLPMQMLSFDGITLPSPETREGIFMGPANRIEFLIKGPATPGTYTFRSIVNPPAGTTDDRFFTNVFVQIQNLPMVKIIVEGEPMEMSLPPRLNPPIARLPDIADSEIVRRREITLDMNLVPAPAFGTNVEGYFNFTMNYKAFDPNRVDEILHLGDAEEWTLRTTDPHSAHPFHIHVNWFQVVAINGYPLSRPRWQDTVTVPKGNQTVTIRHRFQNFKGRFVMHCHIVRHEDAGMMALIDIIDPKNFLYGDDTQDPEGDGFLNIFHHAFGFPSNFRNLKPFGFPQFSTTTVGDQVFSTVKFNRRLDPLARLEYHVEASPDLRNWTPVQTVLDTSSPTNSYETVTLRDSLPVMGAGSAPARFVRMNVVRTEFMPMPIPAGFPQ